MAPELAAILISVSCVACFALAFVAARVVPAANSAIRVSATGVAALTSKTLTEEEKESAVQKASLKLLLRTVDLAARFALCVLAAAIPVYAAGQMDLVPVSSSLAVLANPYFLIASTIGALLILKLASLARKPKAKDHQAYSPAEQVVHMVAFVPAIQKALFGFDNLVQTLFTKRPKETHLVFVTSLARGGTTACLNAMYSLETVGTNTYRDMPFLTAPVSWNALSGLMRRKTERHERAHGDGIEIDLDSPEAFDEVYWKLWWPHKYRDEGIQPWDAGDFTRRQRKSLGRAFEKVLTVRGRTCRHYVSKNNANIARLAMLKEAFGDCSILVPLRRPAPHAASLLRQHENFVRQQGDDPFVQRYMKDIGHYEFGLAHKPILFEGFDPAGNDEMSPDYWLHYWIAAFSDVLTQADRIEIVLQDELRSRPDPVFKQALARVGIEYDSSTDFSGYFRRGEDVTDESVFDPALLNKANRIYDALAARRTQGDLAQA